MWEVFFSGIPPSSLFLSWIPSLWALQHFLHAVTKELHLWRDVCNPGLSSFIALIWTQWSTEYNLGKNNLFVRQDCTLAKSPDSSSLEKWEGYRGMLQAICGKGKLASPAILWYQDNPLLHWFLTVFINCFIRSLIVSVPNGKKREDSSWGQMCVSVYVCVRVCVCVEWCNVFF